MKGLFVDFNSTFNRFLTFFQQLNFFIMSSQRSNDESVVSGLCYIRDMVRHPFPLHSIKVAARVLDLNAQVHVTQTYWFDQSTEHIFNSSNNEGDNGDQSISQTNNSVECVYVFPLDEYSAVSEFECTIDGKTVRGVVKPKASAKQEYEKAISSSKQAALLEQHLENVFECRVGHLTRSSTANIKLTYLTTLTRAGAQHQLTVPMIVAPKYTPAGSSSIPHTTSLPGNFSFECDMEMASPIVKVECLSHPDMIINRDESNRQSNLARASLLVSDNCSLSRDLVLSIHQSKPFEPRCIVEYDPSMDCCSVSLSLDCPSLSLSEASQLQAEYVFLLDRSGSMEGESITALQQSVNLLIKSLPAQCRFQIIGFGSSYQSLFSKGCADYNDESVKKALQYTSKLAADMGGTELLEPLKHALTANRTEWPRCVFVITDGQVSNTGELVSSIAQHRSNTRIFSIGIGSAVDRQLCRKLARSGAGEAEFVSLDRAGDMKSSVLRQLGRAMQPMITNVNVNWGSLSNTSSLSCPEKPSAVFPGTRFGIYLLDCQLPQAVVDKVKANLSDHVAAQHSIDPFEHIVTITAHTNQSGKTSLITMKVPVTAAHLTHGSVIGRLAARSRIAELEQRHAETVYDASNPAPFDKDIERLAMRFGLASRATSFLVVFDGIPQDITSEAQNSQMDFGLQQMSSNCFRGAPRMRMMAMARPMALCAMPPPPPACAPMPCDSAPAPLASFARGGGLRKSAPTAHASIEACEEESASIDSKVAGSLQSSEKKKKSSLFGSFFGGAAKASKRERSSDIMCESDESSVPNIAASSDVFDQLIMMQNAGGSWDLNETLIKTIQSVDKSIDVTVFNMKSVQSLVQSNKQSIKQAQEVIATMIVLSVLHRFLSARSDDWQFIEGKAKSFIDQRCTTDQQQSIKQSISNLGV